MATFGYDENNMPAWFKDYDIRTTYLQKLPFATKLYRAMLPWMPRAFEALDLSEYDMVISSCSSCSKGVITRPDAVHICYCHTPTRYVWDFYYTLRNISVTAQAVDLRPAGQAGAHLLAHQVTGNFFLKMHYMERDLWPRANQAHIPF